MNPIRSNDHDALNAAFAEKVAGYTMHLSPGCEWRRKEIPQFTRSADAVLPWLEKHSWSASNLASGIQVNIHKPGDSGAIYIQNSRAPAFPHAAVIALLRAHGVEVSE